MLQDTLSLLGEGRGIPYIVASSGCVSNVGAKITYWRLFEGGFRLSKDTEWVDSDMSKLFLHVYTTQLRAVWYTAPSMENADARFGQRPYT